MSDKKTEKSTKITWEKTNGRTITTNDTPDNIAYAKELGWKRVEKK